MFCMGLSDGIDNGKEGKPLGLKKEKEKEKEKYEAGSCLVALSALAYRLASGQRAMRMPRTTAPIALCTSRV